MRSENLELISQDLAKCIKSAIVKISAEYSKSFTIDCVIETGKVDPTIMNDENVVLIGLYPDFHVGMNGYGFQNKRKLSASGKHTDTELHTLYHKSFNNNTFFSTSRYILELDTNLVAMLASKKRAGIDITENINISIVDKIEYYFANITDFLSRVVKNITSDTGLVYLEELTNMNQRSLPKPPAIKMNREIYTSSDDYDLFKRKHYSPEAHSILIRMVFDLYLISIADKKLIKNKISDDSYIQDYRALMKNVFEFGPEEGLSYLMNIGVYSKGFYSGLFANDYVAYVIRTIKYLASQNNVIEANTMLRGLKYKPIYNFNEIVNSIKEVKEIVEENNSEDIPLSESIKGIFNTGLCVKNDYSNPSDVVLYHSLTNIAGVKRLVESNLSSYERDVLLEGARRIDDVNVEFEFMHSQYEKKSAMEKAYNVIEFLEKRKNKMRSKLAITRIEELINATYDAIKRAREAQTYKDRMTIRVNYPEGFQG